MNFAVIGDKGMFGQEMSSLIESFGKQVARLNRSNFDLSRSPKDLAEVIGRADFIINAVAFTGVDAAEYNIEKARLVNGEYVGKLAEVALILDAKLMQISTDYVFPGSAVYPIKTSAHTQPVNAYGSSKLLGEQLLMRSGSRFQIFRTAWLYGARGDCFPKAIAKKVLELGSCDVVNDQFGQPTWAKDLAKVVYTHCIENYDEPVVHAVASGSASWFEFAKAIVADLPDSEGFTVRPLASHELIGQAKRPNFSILDNTETAGPIIGNWMERWKIAAPEILASI